MHAFSSIDRMFLCMFYLCFVQFSHLVPRIGFYLWLERFKVSAHRVRPFPVWGCWLIAILMIKYAVLQLSNAIDFNF